MSGIKRFLVLLLFGMLFSAGNSCSASVERLPQVKVQKQARNIKVLCFSADWAAPCKKVQADLEKLSQENQSVSVETVNVDDPNNETLLKKYDICPVPTLVFLDDNKQVISYSIGYPGTSTLNKEIDLLLNAKNQFAKYHLPSATRHIQ